MVIKLRWAGLGTVKKLRSFKKTSVETPLRYSAISAAAWCNMSEVEKVVSKGSSFEAGGVKFAPSALSTANPAVGDRTLPSADVTPTASGYGATFGCGLRPFCERYALMKYVT